MGGGHHDEVEGNEHNIYESDEEIRSKIRHIELIKHNPTAFHLFPYNVGNIWNILGGLKWTLCAGAGGYFGWQYYCFKLSYQPATYYAKIIVGFSRIALGLTVGGWIGYMKFGDRQKLHNAWVAERLMRRYPEAQDLSIKDLWKLKGVTAGHEFYKWT